MKWEFPLIIVFVTGVLMALSDFVPHQSIQNIREFFMSWLQIIGVLAVGLGIYSLVHVNLIKIRRRVEGWGYALITLIGLIAKNGILIVEFANQLQITEGFSKRKAIENAAAIRLRPILMTTVSMIVAMVPLLMASGPGAVSRFHIGLTIATGLGIGTLFTLFVVPAVYMVLSSEHKERRQPGDSQLGPTPGHKHQYLGSE